MSWTTLKCTTLPDTSLPFLNSIFLGPAEATAFGLNTTNAESTGIVEIKLNEKETVVYTSRYHKDVPAGNAVFNKSQRGLFNISPNDPVFVRAFEVPSNVNFNLQKLNISVDIVTNAKISLDEAVILEIIQKRFAKFMFCRNQILLTDLPGKGTIYLTVEECDIVDLGDDEKGLSMNKYPDRGFILPRKTVVTITPNRKNAKIIWTEARKNTVPTPPTNWDDLGIGGLNKEFASIFRRAFASRSFPPDVVKKLGIMHVRGMLLYGPPGTGKTLIARKIGEMLHGKAPKVVNGPEILSKYVGEAEKNMRELFADAQAEYKEKGDNSDLHIIIFDEIDAICKQRGTVKDGTSSHDTVVNQMLSMIDGVNSINNVLVIGMTNRKDMLDEALLRPGRLEVQVEIGLPDEDGRLSIFQIHTKTMKRNGILGEDVNLPVLAAKTKNYSGAEIAGVVKAAVSFGMNSKIAALNASGVETNDLGSMKVTMDDFLLALDDVRPAFGVEEEQLKNYIRNGMIPFGESFRKTLSSCEALISQVKQSEKTPLLSVLIEGKSGSGLTALAAHLGVSSEFPYAKMISPEDLIGYHESNKAAKISKIFEDSYRSPLSLIILDNIERLLEYVRIGPRFSNVVLQTLLVLIKRVPPNQKTRLLIIGTTSSGHLLDDLTLREAFQVCLSAPMVQGSEEIRTVLKESAVSIAPKELDLICKAINYPVGIKTLLLVIEMASQYENGIVTFENFMKCMETMNTQ